MYVLIYIIIYNRYYRYNVYYIYYTIYRIYIHTHIKIYDVCVLCHITQRNSNTWLVFSCLSCEYKESTRCA